MSNTNNNPIIAGLDIGTTKICVVVGRENAAGSMDILGMGRVASEGVDKGVVKNLRQTQESIAQALKLAKEKSGVDIQEVYVGIAGQHIKTQRNRAQIVRANSDSIISQTDIDRLSADMGRMAVDPGHQVIHIIPQEYGVDREFNIQDPIGRTGTSLSCQYHIVSGVTQSIQNIRRSVEENELYVKELVLEPIASSESVLSEEEKEAGVALIDIGGGTTDLAIFHEGIIRHTAVFAMGGKIVTDDIKEGCKVMYSHAEEMKRNYGDCLPSNVDKNAVITIKGLNGAVPREISLENLSNIIRARMEEILEQIDYEIQYSGYKDKLLGGVVITGGGAMLKNLPMLTSFMLGMETRMGQPNQKLNKYGAPDGVISPAYATSLGLVLYGNEREKAASTGSANELEREEKNAKKQGRSFFALPKNLKQFINDKTSKEFE